MSYSSEVLEDSPAIYWRLGEASGTTAADASGNGRTGTYVNGPVLGVPGLLASSDTAVRFNNDNVTNMYVEQSTDWDTVQDDLSAFTIEAICNITDARHAWGYSEIANFYDAVGGGTDVELNHTSNGADDAFGYYITSNNGWIYENSFNLTVGTTYHLALTYDGTSVKFYVNGVDVTGSPSIGGSPGFGAGDTVPLKAGTRFRVGDDGYVNGDGVNGVIDEAAFYKHALTADRIAAHFAAMSSPDAPSSGTLNITGRYRSPDTSIPTGNVIISTIDPRIVDTTDDVIIDQQPLAVILDGDGSFAQSVIVAANGYHVIENIDGVTDASPGYISINPTTDYDMSGSVVPATPSEPTFFYVSGNWANLDGSPASGTVSFIPIDDRFINNGNIILKETTTVTLDGNGGIVQKLVQADNGYEVIENINGGTSVTFTIAAVANIKLSGGIPITVPDAPFSVAATIIDSELTIIWTPPEFDGGLPVTDYVVTVSDDVTTPTYLQVQTFTEEDIHVAVFTDIVADVNYAISVVAHQDAGYSAPTTVGLLGPLPDVSGRDSGSSADNTGTTTGGGSHTPTIPTSVSGVFANGAAFVTWKSPASGSMPKEYVVTCTGQTTQIISATSATWQKCVFTGLTVGSSYTVTVAARNLVGTSAAVSTGSNTVIYRHADFTTAAGDRLAGYQVYGGASSLIPYTGDGHITTNTTLMGYQIDTSLTVDSGATLTLRGCRVRAATGSVSATPIIAANSTGLVDVQFCEIDGSTGPSSTDFMGNQSAGPLYGISGGKFTIQYTYIHNATHCVHVAGSNVNVKFNYMSDMVTSSNAVTPYGIFTNNGSSLNYTANAIRNTSSVSPGGNESACIAAATMGPSGSSVSNLTAHNNFLDGGYSAMMVGPKSGNSMTNLIITDNVFVHGAHVTTSVNLGGTNFSITVDRVISGVPNSGVLWAGTDKNGWIPVVYSGRSSNVFTGCNGGPGRLTAASTINPWSSATNYAAGNRVSYNGHYYEALIANTNHAPTSYIGTHWALGYGGTVRISNADTPIGGLWFNSGFANAVQLRSGTISGTYTHTGNVYNDGPAVTGF